nr:uncharacterized protein LOC116777643 [Danaus plexippus plexippus]
MYQNKMRVREPLPKCEANGTILTMLRFCRVFSLAPLRFTRVRNGVYRITTSRVLFIFSTPLPIIINALMILLYRSILQTEIQRVNFAFAFVKILLLVVVGAPDVLTTSLAILKGQGRMRNLMSVLNQIQKIRRRIGYDYSLDPSTLKIILIMVGPFILNMSLHVLGLYVDDVVDGISNIQGICLSVIIFICHNIILTMQLQYFFLAVLLRLTSETLNKKLTLFTIQGAGGMVVSRCNHKHLRNLYGSYLLIWEGTSELMRTEGLYLVMILFALITRIFMTTYNLWRYSNDLGKLLKQ